jgi:hypothetical protein
MRVLAFRDNFTDRKFVICKNPFSWRIFFRRGTSMALMRRLLRDLFACGCVWCATGGTPCSAEVMTLESALASAYLSNPQLEAQRASLRATDEEVAKALGGWRPTLTGTGSFGWQRDKDMPSNLPSTISTPQSEQIMLTQPLFDGRTLPSIRHARLARTITPSGSQSPSGSAMNCPCRDARIQSRNTTITQSSKQTVQDRRNGRSRPNPASPLRASLRNAIFMA